MKPKFNHIGKFLKTLRTEAGLTQVQMAKLAGLHVQAVSNYERGVSGIPVKAFKRLNKAIGISREGFGQALAEDDAEARIERLRGLYGK